MVITADRFPHCQLGFNLTKYMDENPRSDGAQSKAHLEPFMARRYPGHCRLGE
jgi:hypothetical protein